MRRGDSHQGIVTSHTGDMAMRLIGRWPAVRLVKSGGQVIPSSSLCHTSVSPPSVFRHPSAIPPSVFRKKCEKRDFLCFNFRDYAAGTGVKVTLAFVVC